MKYILIVLVAALIIAAVVTVVTGWTDALGKQSNKTTETMSEGTSKQLCDMRENTGTCYKGSTGYSTNVSAWICNSTATKQYLIC